MVLFQELGNASNREIKAKTGRFSQLVKVGHLPFKSLSLHTDWNDLKRDKFI